MANVTIVDTFKKGRQTWQDFLIKLRQEQISTHTTAQFASELSIRACSRLIIRLHCKYVQNKLKWNFGKLENYVCDKEVVKRALEAATGGYKETGISMTRKRTELARKAQPQKRHGLPVTRTLNCGQVR